ncbi:MAG TPA: hypothetical protein DEB17_02400 [Chlorobaculum sp.]|uniref:Uncharacterized protein n=1 Tax=Chlorobaculum tepidum (strain ATCC 49652 / DSM 12025 / NBRC 103806 / TLS) TaxID=194439 RepID=Q8KEJ5_CHLTE|nr:hypothetical protein CT0693 [Chlorobaculum tepidum TLS]HBU22848.1 hypothetical protein [Chlorobaculum sp.]
MIFRYFIRRLNGYDWLVRKIKISHDALLMFDALTMSFRKMTVR